MSRKISLEVPYRYMIKAFWSNVPAGLCPGKEWNTVPAELCPGKEWSYWRGGSSRGACRRCPRLILARRKRLLFGPVVIIGEEYIYFKEYSRFKYVIIHMNLNIHLIILYPRLTNIFWRNTIKRQYNNKQITPYYGPGCKWFC